MRHLLCGVITVLLICTGSVQRLYSAEYTVDPKHPRSVNFVPSTHSDIPSALAEAADGDTIYLRNGLNLSEQYYYGGTYTITKEITFTMDYWTCPTTAPPIINGLVIQASNVTIGTNGGDHPCGLEIKNDNSTADLVTVSNADNVVIQNCKIHSTDGAGIRAQNASNLKIAGNTVYAIGENALHLENCDDALILSNAIGLENNGISRKIDGNGIFVIGCSKPEIRFNTIRNCFGPLGAVYAGPSTTADTDSLKIIFNHITENYSYNAILLDEVGIVNYLKLNYVSFNRIGSNIFSPVSEPPCDDAEVYHGNAVTLLRMTGKTMVSHNSIRQNIADVTQFSCGIDSAYGGCGHPGSGIYIYPDENGPEPEIFIRNNLITMFWDEVDGEWKCWYPDNATCPTNPGGECCTALATYDCAVDGPGPTNETYADYNFIGGPQNIVISSSIYANSPLGKFFLTLLLPFLDIGGDNWQLKCEMADDSEPATSGGHGGSCGAMEVDCGIHIGYLRQQYIDDEMDVSLDYSSFDTGTGILTQQFSITNNVTDDETSNPVTMYSPQVVSPFMWYYGGIPNPFDLILEDYSFAEPLPYDSFGFFSGSGTTVQALEWSGADFNWHDYFGLTDSFCTDGGYPSLDEQCTVAGKTYPWWSLNIDGGSAKLDHGQTATFTQKFHPVGWHIGDHWWMLNFNYVVYQTQVSPLQFHWYFTPDKDDIWSGGLQSQCGGNAGAGDFMELPDFSLAWPDNTDNTYTASSGILDKDGYDTFGEILAHDSRFLDIIYFDPATGEPDYLTGGLSTSLYGYQRLGSYAKLQARVYTDHGEEVFTLFDSTFFYDNMPVECEPYDYDPSTDCQRMRTNAAPYPFNVWEYFYSGYGYDLINSINYMNIDLYKVICEGLYEGKRINKEDINDIELEFVVNRVNEDYTTKLCIDEIKLSDETANMMKVQPSLLEPANLTRFPDPGAAQTLPVTFKWMALADEEYDASIDMTDELFYHLFLEKCSDESCLNTLDEAVYTRYVDVVLETDAFGREEEHTIELTPGKYQWKIVALDNHGYGDATPIKYFIVEGEDLIELNSFNAVPGNKQVSLQWKTASEIDNAGFNIYRSRTRRGPFIKINKKMIPAKGNSVSGSRYEYIDKNVLNGLVYYYKLEDVDTSGKSTEHPVEKARPLRIHALIKR